MSLSPILTSAAFAPIQNTGWIRITGEDRVRWLNGMVTNSIQSLKPGEGCYNFFLNAQGRIQGDATAWMLDDAIMLETAADRIPAMMAMLDHFIIMDDVELADVTGDGPGVLLAGADAFTILQSLGILNREPDSQSAVRGKFNGQEITVIHAHSPLVPRFELWPESETLAALTDALTTSATLATPEDLEQLRILEGTPLYGTDIRDKDLPQETNQTRALHFSKGCYLGQEIVERIRSRGQVHRTFSGFILNGELPTPGAVLTADDKPAGELTSVTSLNSQLITPNSKLFDTSFPTNPHEIVHLALGYIRREAVERGAAITYPGGTATPSALPFQLPRIESLTHA
jgi:aminomethyltransferase